MLSLCMQGIGNNSANKISQKDYLTMYVNTEEFNCIIVTILDYIMACVETFSWQKGKLCPLQ